MHHEPPHADELIAALRDARERTLQLVEDLDDDQLMGPRLSIVNPLLWEIAHVAWFQEYWVLRGLRGEAPIRADGDRLYDSGAVPHDVRWSLPLPSRAETLAYMDEVLERIVDGLQRSSGAGLTPDQAYFHQLALFHEDMHDEAFTYTRQTLRYPAPGFVPARSGSGAGGCPGDVEHAGGTFRLGAARGASFTFDNEKWAHPVEVAPFRMARAPVTQGEFLAFVEDGGYERSDLWDAPGREWRATERATHPLYWRREGVAWSRRWFDEWIPLETHLPVLHVNWFEASAYCRWAGRRLPLEAEWELAACAGADDEKPRYAWGTRRSDATRANLDGIAAGCVEVGALPAGDTPAGLRQMTGNVWEWTETDFQPYPGFAADPYEDYSQPWFGTRRVLRGGCWITRSRMIGNTYRNFYTPDRRDVWAGFRTCACD